MKDMNREFRPISNREALIRTSEYTEKKLKLNDQKQGFNTSVEDELLSYNALTEQVNRDNGFSKILDAQAQKEQLLKTDIALGEQYNKAQGELYQKMFNGDLIDNEEGSQNIEEIRELAANLEKNKRSLEDRELINNRPHLN